MAKFSHGLYSAELPSGFPAAHSLRWGMSAAWEVTSASDGPWEPGLCSMGLVTSPLTGDPGTTFSPVFVLYLVGCGTKDGPSPSSPIFRYAIDSIAASASILFFVNMDCEYYVDLLDLRIWSGLRLHVSGSLCTHKSHAYFQKRFQGSGQILRNSQYTHTHPHTHTSSPKFQSSKFSSNSPLPANDLFPFQRRALQVSPCPPTRAVNAWLLCHRLTTSVLSHAPSRSECL